MLLCLACALPQGAMAGDGVFVLSAAELDRVTAGQVDIFADSTALVDAFGPDAFTDSDTVSTVDPGSASAVSFAIGAGSEGANGIVFATVYGEGSSVGLLSDASADAQSGSGAPVLLNAESGFLETGNELTAQSTGAAVGEAAFATSYTGLGAQSGAGAADLYAEALSESGGDVPAIASTATLVSFTPGGQTVAIGAEGSGDGFTASGAAAALVAPVGEEAILLEGSAEAIAEGTTTRAEVIGTTNVGQMTTMGMVMAIADGGGTGDALLSAETSAALSGSGAETVSSVSMTMPSGGGDLLRSFTMIVAMPR